MRFLIHFTAYDSHYPNPNVYHETVTVSRKTMDKPGDKEGVSGDIRRKRGFSRVVIDSWEEEKPLADKKES